MKILQMISKNDRYGAQRIFLDQVDILHRMGHEVTVACRGNEGFVTDSARKLGVPYVGTPMKGFSDLFFLRKFIKKNNIDVVHTTLDRADHMGLLAGKTSGVPVVSTNMVPRAHFGFRFMDRVAVLAEKQRPILLGRGVPPGKIVLIRPGIDVRRFAHPDPVRRDSWKRTLRTDERSIVFCHISSVIPRKAHEVSMEITAGCKQRGERPLLIIIGDPVTGPFYDALRARAESLGITGNVHFTGWTAEVPEILANSHFTILPSENEALGVVLMEGMAAGTPIVARAGEGGAELIDEYGTGFLYRPEAGVSGLVDQLIALRHDGPRFSALSEKCRKIAEEEFSIERFGEKLMNLYTGLRTKG